MPPFIEALKAERKETVFGDPGAGTTPAGGRAAEQFGSDLGAGHEREPGGQGHADQQAFEMGQEGDLVAFPVPALGFEVTKRGFDGIPLAVQVEDLPMRPQIGDQT